MRFAEAYRNLVRPSSALEPSHSPDGVYARTRFTTFRSPECSETKSSADVSSRRAQHLVTLVRTPRLYQTRLLRVS